MPSSFRGQFSCYVDTSGESKTDRVGPRTGPRRRYCLDEKTRVAGASDAQAGHAHGINPNVVLGFSHLRELSATVCGCAGAQETQRAPSALDANLGRFADIQLKRYVSVPVLLLVGGRQRDPYFVAQSFKVGALAPG
jgi:hypothetical protein